MASEREVFEDSLQQAESPPKLIPTHKAAQWNGSKNLTRVRAFLQPEWEKEPEAVGLAWKILIQTIKAW